jgi:hypothetical protein
MIQVAYRCALPWRTPLENLRKTMKTAWFKSCRFWVTLFPDFKMLDPVKLKAWALWRSFESVTLD